jgi:hypothetical protein
VWGNYTVQVKDSGNYVCGSHKNAFDDNQVSLDQSAELTLSFSFMNGLWYGSEVRILQAGGYSYGTFTYSVKDISVFTNGTVTAASSLPDGLVLSMFTSNPLRTEGHVDPFEIDIDISKLGNQSNIDVQFLIPPAVAPHYYAFTSATNGFYNEAPQTYEFTWLPTSVLWNSSAGGGQGLFYTTALAIAAGQPDLVQCLPADIDARISLRSFNGAGQDPAGMTKDQVVKVVIDKFKFTPIHVTGVADGETCSKACQCLSGHCQQNYKCVSP